MNVTPRFTAVLLAMAAAAQPLAAQRGAQTAPQPGTIEETIPPGANFDKANFRLWTPPNVKHVQAVVVLVPGSNGDGRSMAADTAWQAFATRHDLALVACQITDKPHDQNFIEEYVNVGKGSGQALLDALTSLGKRSSHPEIGTAPIFLWGMSAGGEFDYEFVAWKPERVLAFVVNKGGIYYTALAPLGARNTPGLLFIGGKDLDSRVQMITGLFAVNRRAGALWALTEEPSAAHVVGRSRDLGIMFFEDVLALRMGDPLKTLSDKNGFLGDIRAKTVQPFGDTRNATSMAWLPTERIAKAWQAVVTDKPFDQ